MFLLNVSTILLLLSVVLNIALVIMLYKKKPSAAPSQEELRSIFDAGAEAGEIDEAEFEMINNIFEFDDKTAGDIVIHRTDLVAVSVNATFEKIVDVFTTEKYSRIPVYEENIDNIVGILYIKDIISYLASAKSTKTFDVKAIMRKPYFVPFSKKTNELFKEMKKNKVHLTVVLDEYGGTVGIVTMEDLIEEVLGNILDEHDEEEIPEIKKLDENTYEISGMASLTLVSEILEAKLPVDEYDTLSGFLIGQLGHIPEDIEKPEIEFEGILFKVDSVKEKRIKSTIVCRV